MKNRNAWTYIKTNYKTMIVITDVFFDCGKFYIKTNIGDDRVQLTLMQLAKLAPTLFVRASINPNAQPSDESK